MATPPSPGPVADDTLRTPGIPTTTMPSANENEHSTTLSQAASEAAPTLPKEVDFTPRTKEFWFLPIPKSRRYDPERPIHFGLFLNVIFGAASTFGE